MTSQSTQDIQPKASCGQSPNIQQKPDQAPQKQTIPDGYKIITTKTGKTRLQKVYTEEERKARLQKMLEGKQKKNELRQREKREQEQRDNELKELKDMKQKQLTRDDVKAMLDEYFNNKKDSTAKDSSRQEPVKEKIQIQQQANPSTSKDTEEIKKETPQRQRKHVQKVVKSRHPLIPDQVIEVSVSEDS